MRLKTPAFISQQPITPAHNPTTQDALADPLQHFPNAPDTVGITSEETSAGFNQILDGKPSLSCLQEITSSQNPPEEIHTGLERFISSMNLRLSPDCLFSGLAAMQVNAVGARDLALMRGAITLSNEICSSYKAHTLNGKRTNFTPFEFQTNVQKRYEAAILMLLTAQEEAKKENWTDALFLWNEAGKFFLELCNEVTQGSSEYNQLNSFSHEDVFKLTCQAFRAFAKAEALFNQGRLNASAKPKLSITKSTIKEAVYLAANLVLRHTDNIQITSEPHLAIVALAQAFIARARSEIGFRPVSFNDCIMLEDGSLIHIESTSGRIRILQEPKDKNNPPRVYILDPDAKLSDRDVPLIFDDHRDFCNSKMNLIHTQHRNEPVDLLIVSHDSRQSHRVRLP